MDKAAIKAEREKPIDDRMIIYSNRIDEELHLFFERFLPDDQARDVVAVERAITEASQGRFNAAMMHCGKVIFPDRAVLKVSPYMRTPGTTILTNNNTYNYDLLERILEYYIYLCALYDKEVSSYGFCYLCNIDQSTYTLWLNSIEDDTCGNSIGYHLAQKIRAANEGSLSDILTSGKRNPVAILGALNHRHGWNMPGVRDAAPRRQALAAADLPRLAPPTPPDVVQVAQQKDDARSGPDDVQQV